MNSNEMNDTNMFDATGTTPSANHQPRPRADKQAQLRAAARPIIRPTTSTTSSLSSSSHNTGTSISAAVVGGLTNAIHGQDDDDDEEEDQGQRSLQQIRPRFVRSTSQSIDSHPSNTKLSETTGNVRVTPVAQGEWKSIPFIVPSVSYPGLMSTPPTPRSLHAAAVLHLPLGMSTYSWYTRTNYNIASSSVSTTHPSSNNSNNNDTTSINNVQADLASTLAPKFDTVLVVFGGYEGEFRSNSCFEYDFHHKCWSLVVPLDSTSSLIPKPRDRHVAVSHGTTFYIFGGFDSTSRINDFWGFDYRNRSWRPIVARPPPPSTTLVGEQQRQQQRNDILPAHLQSWVHSDSPSARHSHCAAVYKNGIYIFGTLLLCVLDI